MSSGLHIALSAERVGSVFGIPVTNALITALFVSVLLIIVGYIAGRKPKLKPGKMQSAFEMLFEFVLEYMEKTLGTRALAERFFPLIATIFLFIFTANLLEFFPFIGSIGLVQGGVFVPLFRAATTDLNVTVALAIIVFLTIEISGIMAL